MIDSLKQFHFFDISFQSLNLLSGMVGMLWGSALWRGKGAVIAALYFAGIALYYYLMYYMVHHPHLFH